MSAHTVPAYNALLTHVNELRSQNRTVQASMSGLEVIRLIALVTVGIAICDAIRETGQAIINRMPDKERPA